MRANGNIEFPPDFFFELDKALKSKTGISEKVEASLAWLRSRHPEIKSRSEIKRIIDYVINEPEVIKQKEMVKR